MTKAELTFPPGVPKQEWNHYVPRAIPFEKGVAVTSVVRQHLVGWARKSGFYDTLPPRQKQVLDMRYGKEPCISVAIAETLGIPAPTVTIAERSGIRNIILAKEGGPKALIDGALREESWAYLDPLEQAVLYGLHKVPKNKARPTKEEIAQLLKISGDDEVSVIEANAFEKLYTVHFIRASLAGKEKIHKAIAGRRAKISGQKVA